MQDLEPLITSAELGDRLGGIPTRTLDQWAYLGKGPRFVRVGRYRRYRPADVEAWLDAQSRGGDAHTPTRA